MLSAVLAATSLSCLSAVTGFAADDTNASEYGLMENIQDGTILHCFDWKNSDIKAELPNIAAAGFTSVQTSPAQPGGNHDPNTSTGTWWWLYQPLSFSIGTNYLGTKEELQELCTEADKYGIKIIVDIVANHLAGDHTYIQEDLKDSKYWRTTQNETYWNDITDKRYKTTHKDLGMPDIVKVKDNDDLLGKTAKAMQNYGAWARQYLISANKIAETSGIAEPIAITDVDSDDLKDYNVVKSSAFSVPDLNMSLLVESETSIRVYYTGDKIDAAVSSSGKNVDFVSGTKDGYNYIEIPNISAQDIDKTFTISFGDKGTLNVSALSYAYAALKAHEDDDSYTDICNTVRALFKYNQAAEEFFS